jgi:hypothetical protein
MNIFLKLTIFILILPLASCGGLGTPEDNKKAKRMSGSVDQIIARSGTTFRNQDSAMKDAYNRLNTGGGMLGKKPMGVEGLFNQNQKNSGVASIGLPINAILWKSSLETINFMPLSSVDPFSGVIITDWYSSSNQNERCKINIFIKGREFKSTNLDVNIFCQNLIENMWLDSSVNKENNLKLENAILNSAKKMKLSIN